MNTQNKTYNGWTNYETWLIALHIDNDQYLQDEALNNYDEDTYNYSKCLESWFEDIIEEILSVKNPLISDLINSTLSEVNWYEIAKHYQTTYKEVNEYEEEE